MKLGVPWTSKGKKGSERSAPNDAADTGSVHERLDDLTRQLERISRITAGKARPPQAAAEPAVRPRPAPPPEDHVERPRPAARRPEPDAARDQDDVASGEVARFAGDRTLNRNPLRAVYSAGNLDETLAEIAARQRDLEGRSRPLGRSPAAHRPMTAPAQNLSGLEDQLRKITTQIEGLRRPPEAQDAVPALRQELAEISRSLADAMPRRAIEAIEVEVRSLAERLDHSRERGADGRALGNIEHGLAEVRDALRSLKPAESLVGFQAAIQGLSRKVDTIVATQQDPAMLRQLEGAITGLRGIVAHVASDDTLARLTEEVRGIAVKLEHTAGAATAAESMASLERQIGAIAEAIDQTNARDRQVPARLEALVRGLAEKIEKLQLSRGDTIAFGQLEGRIAKLVEKLDASGSRFNHLEAIERGLADVLVHLEEQRARGREALRPADPAIDSVKHGLDAVNGTLSRVVERLATIETGIRARASNRSAPGLAAAPAPAPHAVESPPAIVAPAPPPPPVTLPAAASIAATLAPGAAATPPARPVAALSERLAAAARAHRPAAPRERPPIDPNLPPDHPLEPGAARPASPADRIAASEAALGPARPTVSSESGNKTNFIAAARRAAQTALRLPEPTEDKSTPERLDAEPKPPLRQRLSGRIRMMLVGGSVVILTLAAARIGMTLLEPFTADAPATTKPAPAPAILPPAKSGARIQPAPAIPSAAPRSASSWDVAPGEVQSPDQPAVKPPEARAATDAPVPTGAAPEVPPAMPKQTDITGSIPSWTESAAVPMPPDRPHTQGAGEHAQLVAAATAGDPAAAYELAVRHIEGLDGKRDYVEAARWLDQASKAGLVPAQFRLGSLYEKGLGVKKNANEARKLYRVAAEKGNAKAMHNLAVLYAEGVDGKPDYKTAVEWFRKGANHGIADSQYNLGVLYARGVGIEQNLAEAYKWFALAAQQGDKEAARKREDVTARLDAESLMAARLAVKTWTKEPEPDEAVNVKTPPGGWDRDAQPAQVKRRPRAGAPKGAPLKIGPG